MRKYETLTVSTFLGQPFRNSFFAALQYSLRETHGVKHVIAKMPMVTFVITSLTRLTAVVCMEKGFNSSPGNRRIFSSTALRDSFSHLAQIVPSEAEKVFKKTL